MLGVLGGMGPMATADFLAKLTRATDAARDQDHMPMIVWNDPRIPDRTDAILGRGPSPAAALRRAAAGLAEAGARAIVMPCNTAHRWAAEVEAASRLPLLHIVDAVLDAAPGAQRLGLLATEGTLAGNVYADRARRRAVAMITPDAAGQRAVSEAIALVKGGRYDAAAPLVRPVLEALRSASNAVVLACTELPLIVPSGEAGVIDATEALAGAAARWWREQLTREQAA